MIVLGLGLVVTFVPYTVVASGKVPLKKAKDAPVEAIFGI